jgi:ubiquitin C
MGKLSPLTPIDNVKAKIQDFDYNIQKESTLRLLLRLCGEMQIVVKTLTVIALEVESSETNDNVKAKI